MDAISSKRSTLSFDFGWVPRVSPVFQSHASECGPACVAMLVKHYGSPLTLADLRRIGQFSARGQTLQQLLALADAAGIQTRPLRVDLDELKSLRLPAIIHLDGNHFVVLERVGRRRAHIIDPSIGRVKIAMKRLSSRFTGVAIEAFPKADFRQGKSKKRPSWLSIFGKVGGVRRSLFWIFVLALSLEVTVLLAPLFVQTVVDTVIANHDARLLAAVAIAYFSLIVCQVVISSFRAWGVAVMSATLTMGWTANVFRHLLHLPDSYFGNRQLGDISSRVGSIDAVQRTVSVGAVEAAIDGLMVSITFAMLIFYSGALAALVAAGTAIYVGIRLAALRTMMEANVDLITAMASQETTFIDSVRAVGVVRRTNGQGKHTSQYLSKVNEVQKRGLALHSIQMIFSGAGTILFGGVKIAALFFGARAAINGEFSAGMLVAFIAYVDQFTGRSTKLLDFIIGLKMLGIQIDRVVDITSTEPESRLEAVYRGSLDHPDMDCHELAFRYGKDDPWILRGASFRAEHGQMTAIVGPSGCGKSTIVKILSGQIEPSVGKIYVGGIELAHLGKRRLRESTAVVMQDDILLSGTIAQNIASFEEEPDEERIVGSARIAGVDAEISAMPMRYDTLIGDLGALVSGGQKQRICLARALYRAPSILILDEATSHLDVSSERRVMTNLRELGITVIVIAHRPETIEQADQVYELVEGSLQIVRHREEQVAVAAR